MPSRSDGSITMVSNTEIVPMGKPMYPARSSSYRVYSVIDAYAYGGDPGIQFSPTAEEYPQEEDQNGVLDTVRKLRSDEPLSYETIEESSESDLVMMAAMVDDDYDPFRQVSLVGFRQTQKQREQLVQKVYDHQISQKQIDEFVRVRAAIKEKALPAPPPPLPEKEKRLMTKKRSDSVMGDRNLVKVVKVGLPATPSPRPKLTIETQNKKDNKKRPSSKPKEEVTFGTVRSISRQSKPPSLHLKRSNGSTAASISSTGSDSPSLGISPPVPPLLKARTFAKQQDPSAEYRDLVDTIHGSYDRSKALTQRQAGSTGSLTNTTSPLQDRPLPSLPKLATPQDQVLADDIDEDDNEDGDEMKRIRNLVVKRKPVRSDSNNTAISPSANPINKENRPFFSSAPLLGQYLNNKANPSKANVTNAEKESPTVSTVASKLNSRATSPSESVAQFPAVSIESVSPVNNSQDTLARAQSKGEDGTSSSQAPSTPRALLPSPSPISHLEESPSKYAVTKKSEKNLKKDDKPRERTGRPSAHLSGPEDFKNVAERLRQHFSNNIKDNLLEEPIAFRDIAIANEEELDKYIHPSILPMMRSRPITTNAAKLGTVQLHCNRNHAMWFEHSNGPTKSPTDCALCYISDETARWQCCYCALRICTRCKDQVEKTVRSTPLQLKLDEALGETMRMREERRAQMGLYSRPESEESIYEAEEGDMIPRPPTSTSMRSARSTGNLRSQPAYYGNMWQRNEGGGRRFSAGGGIPAPEDYPPPPRMMPQQYPPQSPMRAMVPTSGGGGRGGYGGLPPPGRFGRPENRGDRVGDPRVRLLGNGPGYMNSSRERGERGLRQLDAGGMRGAYPS